MNTEKELSNSKIENYFYEILEVFYDGVYITDSAGKSIWVNSMYEKLTGLKRQELLGKYVQDLQKNGIFDMVLNPIIVKTGKPHTSIQKNKLGRKLVLNGHPVFNQDGQVAYVVTYVRDITVLSQLKEQISSQAELIEKYHYEANILRSGGVNNNIIIKSPIMIKLMQFLERIAETDTTVLILGETGVGKGVFARKIQEMSSRKNGPFLKVNCATIPENLIEAELFGYEPGAFTGASAKGKPGYFEVADKGTLFLDEIGELPLTMQAKLLRVLQDQEVVRVGSTKMKKVDVRFIAATNRNLEDAVKEGTFRRDLYYRLRVTVLDLPPLRERKEEILPLIDSYLEKFNTKYKKGIAFSEKCKQFLQDYKWPGNVREMENLILGLVVTQDKDLLDVIDLPCYLLDCENEKKYLLPTTGHIGERSLREIMDDTEKELLKQALSVHGSISGVAKIFQVDRTTIFRKLKKYNLM